jgi:hypothetical protein
MSSYACLTFAAFAAAGRGALSFRWFLCTPAGRLFQADARFLELPGQQP